MLRMMINGVKYLLMRALIRVNLPRRVNIAVAEVIKVRFSDGERIYG